jgi:D-glycero-beta-D-manno-heptose 1-phosphate adenylyltransferase
MPTKGAAPPRTAPPEPIGEDEKDLLVPVPEQKVSQADNGVQVSAKLFEDRAHTRLRLLPTLKAARDLGDSLRAEGHRIVLTSGSFDLLHVGHAMYLEQARRFGDFLVVGMDSDEKIRARKGPKRPWVNEDVRAKFLTYQRGVGAVYVKRPERRRWTLIHHLRPDVLVATVGTYSHEEVTEIEKQFKCRVIVLDRMTPTSSHDRATALGAGEPLGQQLPLFEL